MLMLTPVTDSNIQLYTLAKMNKPHLHSSEVMLLLWISLGIGIILTILYLLLMVVIDGTPRHIDCTCIIITFVLCVGVSMMFVVAIDGIISIIHDTRVYVGDLPP
jgi:hypothetical protein